MKIKKSMFMKIYIIPMILMTPLMMISCNSWFSIWMMMELNLISFIPFIIYYNKFYKELSIKYFIIQVISSSILLMSSNLMFLNMYNFKLISMNLMNLSLLMKIGSPPFHNWFINLMNNMSWMNCFFISTWQKIIPFLSLMYIYNKYMIYISMILSSFLLILNLNHQSIRIIFSYSSINHMSFMLMNLMISEIIWMFYFLMYMISNLSIMYLLSKFNIYFLNQTFSINNNFNLKFIFLMNFFSFMSLPPFLGFSLKWISIYYSNINYIYIIMILMIIMSILSFIFYTRICIFYLMNYKLNNKIFLINKFNNFKNYKIILILSIFSNLWIISLWMY